MSHISLIAAIDELGGIGNKNKLLAHLPADLSYFKNITMGKPIIMGRRTFESIGRPLPGRENIVISKQLEQVVGLNIFSDLKSALEYTACAKEVMIIGGARLFSECLAYAEKLYITRIHHQFEADVFFPKVEYEQWNCISKIDHPQDIKNQFDITFEVYRRNA